ncbi:MAG: hypothetical protein O2904_04315 [bacterium]|nr:hypothetical protein [bacterium]
MSLHNRAGFMLIDVLIGIVLFGMFMTAIGTSMLFNQRSFLSTGDRMRAVFLAEAGLEAARSVRYEDFSQLSAGTYGMQIGVDGLWNLAGTGTVTSDNYTTTITIAPIDSNTFSAVAATSWDFGMQRAGTITATTELTHWNQVKPLGNWATISRQGLYIDGGTPGFNSVTVSGDYAYITSSAGAGLYVFDISDPATPTRVASSFSLGAAGYRTVVDGTSLYVATGDTGSEVRSYNITLPSSLSAGNLIASANVPGDDRVRALGVFNDTVLVGATEDVTTHHELYSYSTALVLLDSLDNAGSFLDMYLADGYAYLASGQDVAELRVVDIFDPANLEDAAGVGYNLTDVYDGIAIARSGTGILLGRMNGAIIEELILFDNALSTVPSPPPGPFYYEVGGEVTGIAIDPSGTYGFLSSDASSKEFSAVRINSLVAGKPAEAGSYDSDQGFGRGLFYDMQRDRIFLISDSSLEILQPS